MEIVVITGMSGAGKSAAVDVFEDLGFNCVDNMPPVLISKFIEVCSSSNAKFERLAIVVDMRTGVLFDGILDELTKFRESGVNIKILFLEASDDALIKRYKETRRRHPLIKSAGSLIGAVEQERVKLAPVREISDYVIDTSFLRTKNLRDQIVQKFSNAETALQITVISFGQKYGPQLDVDMQFDVRCLPNPFYVSDLKPLTGMDSEVYDYVFGFNSAKEYYKRVYEMISMLLPQFCYEGKTNLTIGFCCTGGKHRSVAFELKLGQDLLSKGYNISVIHRDIDKTDRKE